MNGKAPTIRADYHFHPNLPRGEKRAMRKVARLFARFRACGIGAVIVTEHVYKDPVRAWQMMRAQKPDDVALFPGLEYLTKEGIDICLFAETDAIYQYRWEPYEHTYEAVLHFLAEHPDVRGFVTHPYTLGTTSIVTKKGEAFAKYAIDTLGAVEPVYSVFRDIKRILSLPVLRTLGARTLARIEDNEQLPQRLYPHTPLFFAIGSDAHHVWEIGPSAQVQVRGTVYESVTRNTVVHPVGIDTGALWRLIPAALTTAHEWLMKQVLRNKDGALNKAEVNNGL